jgi:predicted acylesterase/phospholipase RssA
MQGQIGDTSSCRADVTIEPKLKDNIGLLDFKRGPELVEAGERAAEEALPKLRAVMAWVK